MTTNKPRGRGRPRRFDADEALDTAQRLFHSSGYDGVSVSDVTDALGINPPSFYAAFGSKAGLFAKVLDHWATDGAIPLKDILRADRPVAEALYELLEDAAERYASDPKASGCMVIEGTRSNDSDARRAACARDQTAETMIRTYIAERHPDEASALTDFVTTILSGLSAKARAGHDSSQLLKTARLAGSAVRQMLSTPSA